MPLSMAFAANSSEFFIAPPRVIARDAAGPMMVRPATMQESTYLVQESLRLLESDGFVAYSALQAARWTATLEHRMCIRIHDMFQLNDVCYHSTLLAQRHPALCRATQHF